MKEFHDYIRKVMWYCEQEYSIPSCSVEEFESSQHANILIDHCFKHFSSESPFQNCACSLVEYMKQFTGE